MTKNVSDPAAKSPTREWVLVVDDDEPIRLMVAECLIDSGVEVVGASSGAKALELLASAEQEPVLALLDVLMPGIDGLTLAQRLQGRFKRGTIAIMSGHMSNLSWWPMELRDVPFLSKPFRLAELTELLSRAQADYRSKKKS